MVRTLIVSSCTADKRFDSGLKASGLSELTAGDFYYKNTGKIAALRNNNFESDAYSMYVGNQYGPSKTGTLGPVKDCMENLLKPRGAVFDHFIVSAGYGLIKSTDLIVPYDVSFNYLTDYFKNETRGKNDSVGC